MSLELSMPDDTPADLSVHDPSLLERIETLETRAADATALDEVAARLDRIETRLARPGARVESRDDQAEVERKAFTAFLRKGIDGMPDLERKVLSTIVGSPDDGGHWTVPETFNRELIRNLVEVSPIRRLARVQTVAGNPVLLPKRTANLTAQWVAETVQHDLSEPSYEQQSVGIFEARVSVEVSNQLLEDSAFDLAAELARDFAEEFARLEGEAFVRGNGTTQPEGILTSSDFVSTDAAGAITADHLIDLYHSVPAVYSANGTWAMDRATFGAVRKLKATGTGNYLWADSLQPGNPPSLLGRPVVEVPGLVTQGGSPSEVVVIFGDFNAAYRVFDRIGLQVMRDPFSAARRSIVTFHARKRVGGALVRGDALRGLSA
jgi:HK97 family phage major capsid protein